MRLPIIIFAAALAVPATSRAGQIITVPIDGTEDVATGSSAVTIDGPSFPTLITLDASVEFTWPVIVEPVDSSALPLIIPMFAAISVAGQHFEGDVSWNATANDYTDPDFTVNFHESFVASGELDFALDGGACSDMCAPGHGEWIVAGINDDAGAMITGTVSYDPVPEPASMALLGVGMLGLGAVRRRR